MYLRTAIQLQYYSVKIIGCGNTDEKMIILVETFFLSEGLSLFSISTKILTNMVSNIIFL